MKKAALIHLTTNGALLSEKIATGLAPQWNCTRYGFAKYPSDGSMPFDNLRELTGNLMRQYDALVFFCACGIAVRMIAPFLVSKRDDPAVVAVDEQGTFAVSLLSGHLGGANALTLAVADILGATPVITTATDSGGKFSPDLFARANALFIAEPDAAKAAAAAVVRGEKIGFRCDYPCGPLPQEYFTQEGASVGIHIADHTELSPFPTTLHLLPRNITVGVGCKRGTPPARLEVFIRETFAAKGIPLERVRAVHTIDLKKDEPALTAFCESCHLPLYVFPAATLMAQEGDFAHSDFVETVTGADNVCERSAVVGGGRLFLRKTARDGMTLAAAEMPVFIDFGRTEA